MVYRNSFLTKIPKSNYELFKNRVFAKTDYLTETIYFGQIAKQALLADYLQSLLANYLTKTISFGRNSLILAKTVSFGRIPKQAWKAGTVLAD